MIRTQIEYICNTYYDDVHNFLIYYTGTTEVEDIVQEVFLKIIKNIDQFEARSNPKTWIISIARHTAIDHLRKNKRNNLPETLLAFIISKEKTPEQRFIDDERLFELYQYTNLLKQSYRDVLILRGIRELSVQETAEVLGWSETKVKYTLHRAVSKIKRIYQMKENKGGLDFEKEYK
ncbi:RNA polymerase sigma factor [Bacillus alkalicellulosilyticus]|uniref:RNA polymerase sigma factor n=1 Tax=Alkalihalobacterium alkalicellulosilyticum TaxID=1912214 RepID=UPI000997AFDB|nr:RNA polymerase sigma factor [Bacillus alkalicellulosilyticus]